MSPLKRSILPCSLTFLNLLCGSLSVYFSIRGYYDAAALSIVLAVFFDSIDGKVARLVGMVSPIGAQLDSISDAISFGVAPFVFIISRFPQDIFLLACGLFFVACGVFRLARFNVLPKTSGFIGLPITTMGLLFPFLYVTGAGALLYTMTFLVAGGLMISRLRIPRIR